VYGGSHHPPGSKVGALLFLLAIPQEAIQCPDAVWYQVVRLKEVKILGAL
jgi:hypothetical protein